MEPVRGDDDDLLAVPNFGVQFRPPCSGVVIVMRLALELGLAMLVAVRHRRDADDCYACD